MTPRLRLLSVLLLAGSLWAGDAAVVPAPSGASPILGTPTDYRLFPGDLIRIEVFGHADLQVDARVPPQGEVSFPLIGAVTNLAGRAPEAVAGEIATRLADGYIRNPSVQVQVRDYGPRSVFVVGAVRTPGSVALDPLRPSTAMQAIASAGGLSEDADRAALHVLREDPQQPGTTIRIPIPNDETAVANLRLQHGDVLAVPRADRIFVLGQVHTPQAVPVTSREVLTVSKAISLAGGFARFAKDSRVQILRPGQAALTVDVRAVLDGAKDAADPQLQAGDTVFVPESRF